MDKVDVALLFFSVLSVVLSPYTKVEERFNTNAIHDFLYLPFMSNDYDHHTFPGVVPRTSLGAFFVAQLAFPYFKLASAVPGWNKFLTLILVRIVMAFTWVACIIRFRRSVRELFGNLCSQMTGLFVLSQFHLVYYASRPLPNTFAMYFGK
jgi:alpha-1,6-mannosyltransferase